MRAVLTLRENDDATLTSAAHTLRTIEGIRSVTVDEATTTLVVDYDETSIDDGELLNRVAAEGIPDVRLRSVEAT